ncbi:MAG TPA: hypothetical protein VF207_04400 [Chthoniobacterales bacterium]
MKTFWTTVLALAFSGVAAGFAQVSPELTPVPGLSPEQVVQYQVWALQHNDDAYADAGIERTFRFASPSNKSFTGPLEHFVSIAKSPAYLPMINNLGSSVTGSQIEGDHARVAIRITPAIGPAITYLFVLTRQHVGDFENCWMTDSVVPMQEGESLSGEAITI